MLETHRRATDRGAGARKRILDASYELFSRRGIRAVGVYEVIERAGVATETLYRHFASKDELVLAFLEMREQRWTYGLVEAEAQGRGASASIAVEADRGVRARAISSAPVRRAPRA